MKKNRFLALAVLAISLAFIGACVTTGSKSPGASQGQPGTLSETVRNTKCPSKMAMDISAKYPINTGNAQVDAFFKGKADNYLSSMKNDDANSDEGNCSLGSNLYANSDYKSFKPNPETIGVLTTIETFTGGAHPNTELQSNNFDLRTGKEITIEDLFVKTRTGISGIYDLAYAELCKKTATHDAARAVLGGECGKDKRAPSQVFGLTGPLDNLGHMVLTEQGADLNFLSYDIWSYAQGNFTLPISKDTLRGLGARDFWGPTAPAF
ncbi:MAG: DUF3298 and DUF4163 domain-containing protein [Deltaproteobacteria bacterium]|jgi:hypothetical protein|nr:DUF3298 and DUF4163 domain-containing protein [Deltaproteobacteria bacterium]